MKRRNLSGIYVMYKAEDETERQPTCFEDCPEEKQDQWLDTLDIKALKALAKMLGESLRKIGDKIGLE